MIPSRSHNPEINTARVSRGLPRDKGASDDTSNYLLPLRASGSPVLLSVLFQDQLFILFAPAHTHDRAAGRERWNRKRKLSLGGGGVTCWIRLDTSSPAAATNLLRSGHPSSVYRNVVRLYVGIHQFRVFVRRRTRENKNFFAASFSKKKKKNAT